MSIKTLIQNAKIQRQELVATTVRIPKELQVAIEELADYLLVSKQEVMVSLLQSGIELAEDSLNEDKSLQKNKTTDKRKYFVLNTNKRYNPEDQDIMLEEEIAAAFYSKKYKIEQIKKDDVVFLYENGKGIIAYGITDGKVEHRDYDGDEDEFYYQKLNDFNLLSPPLSAQKTKEILSRNVIFINTLTPLKDGDKLLSYIG